MSDMLRFAFSMLRFMSVVYTKQNIEFPTGQFCDEIRDITRYRITYSDVVRSSQKAAYSAPTAEQMQSMGKGNRSTTFIPER